MYRRWYILNRITDGRIVDLYTLFFPPRLCDLPLLIVRELPRVRDPPVENHRGLMSNACTSPAFTFPMTKHVMSLHSGILDMWDNRGEIFRNDKRFADRLQTLTLLFWRWKFQARLITRRIVAIVQWKKIREKGDINVFRKTVFGNSYGLFPSPTSECVSSLFYRCCITNVSAEWRHTHTHTLTSQTPTLRGKETKG